MIGDHSNLPGADNQSISQQDNISQDKQVSFLDQLAGINEQDHPANINTHQPLPDPSSSTDIQQDLSDQSSNMNALQSLPDHAENTNTQQPLLDQSADVNAPQSLLDQLAGINTQQPLPDQIANMHPSQSLPDQPAHTNIRRPLPGQSSNMSAPQSLLDQLAGINTQQPLPNQLSDVNTQQPFSGQSSNTGAQKSLLDQSSNMDILQPLLDQSSNISSQRSFLDQLADMNTQRPLLDHFTDIDVQQPLLDQFADMNAQQPLLDQPTDMSARQLLLGQTASMNIAQLFPDMHRPFPDMQPTQQAALNLEDAFLDMQQPFPDMQPTFAEAEAPLAKVHQSHSRYWDKGFTHSEHQIPSSSVNHFTKLTYLWRSEPAYKVFYLALATVLISGFVCLAIIGNLFKAPSSTPQGLDAHQKTAMNASTLVHTPTPTATPKPTPSPKPIIEPTISPRYSTHSQLSVQITNIPSVVSNNTTASVGVTTNQPGIIVSLSVAYSSATPAFFNGGSKTTDSDGQATLPWDINIHSSQDFSPVTAHVTVFAQNLNGQNVTSPAANVQILAFQSGQ